MFKFTIILICTRFMFKAINRFALFRMSTQAAVPSNKFEYLLIPTNLPIPPYYFYSTRINQHLFDYLTNYKIKNVAAFAIRPGVHRRKFYPLDKDNFEKELGLSDYQWPQKVGRQTETMLIANNNAFYDGQLDGPEEAPVQLVPTLEQIYPIGSVCTVNLKQDNKNYYLYLRAEVRLEAEWASPKDGSAISVVGGRVLKTEPLAQTTKDYEELLTLYERIKVISTVNLPDIDVKNQKSVAKVIQLLTGYLCTLSYFSADKIYSIFKITVLQDRLPILVKCYREYVNILQTEWKGLSVQTTTETREKEAIATVYENMKRIIGNPGEQKFVDKIRLKLKEKHFPQQVRKLIEAELSAIQTEGSHDISRKKHYVTLLTEYPFGVLAKEEFDIKKAKKILEEDHYGMQKLKRRILEFIAVSNLKGEFKSKVLLLYGPPGVGKTSIVKSIAKCLNRPYARISLGGEYDTAVVKGHRKTYIGAYPGKIWDSIYKSKVENPVILLDEIDKIVSRAGGASLQDAVMQILDPVQNYRYKDDFMDIEIDLSRVLFVCTANSLDTIFPPLLDRLQRIEVAGYTTMEKQEIFNRYIIEQAKEQNGLIGEVGQQIDFTPQGVRNLIEGYCKEAGVRNLVRKTNKIFQKIALKYVQGLEYSKKIMPEHLREFIGLPVFHQARLFGKIPPAGVMIGLAYNNYGGSIMYIECVSQGKPKPPAAAEVSTDADKKEPQHSSSLIVTGNIHDVMKESVQLAYTYSKFVCSTLFNNFYLQQNDVHINFPEIEIGKDGPSAGIAITSAFISLATNTPLQREIAMTGEITLSGRVNPIGGVKEKTMGARREGITTLIFPEQNRKDVQELQAEIKEGMNFYFASHYFQVLQLVLGLKAEQNLKPLPQLIS